MAGHAMLPIEGANETARGLITAYLSWSRELGTKGYGGHAGDAMAGAFGDELAAAAGDPAVMLALVRYAVLLCSLAVDEGDLCSLAVDEGDQALDLWQRIVAAEVDR